MLPSQHSLFLVLTVLFAILLEELMNNKMKRTNFTVLNLRDPMLPECRNLGFLEFKRHERLCKHQADTTFTAIYLFFRRKIGKRSCEVFSYPLWMQGDIPLLVSGTKSYFIFLFAFFALFCFGRRSGWKSMISISIRYWTQTLPKRV